MSGTVSMTINALFLPSLTTLNKCLVIVIVKKLSMLVVELRLLSYPMS